MSAPAFLGRASKDSVSLRVTHCHFVGEPKTIHIYATPDGVAVTDMVLIAGNKLRWSMVFQLKLRPVWYAAKRVRAFFKVVSA